MLRDLNKLGVIQNKHIPLIYLRSSKASRLALLQGLVDSDGHIDKDRGRVHFYNTNRAISSAVAELVSSLGDVPHTSTKVMKGFGVECVAHFVGWKPTEVCVRFPRKIANFQARKITPYRAVSMIERVESVPTKCIAVDSDSRTYLCGESMIPTHNTVIRRHSKRLTLSPEFANALDKDGDRFDERVERQVPAKAPMPQYGPKASTFADPAPAMETPTDEDPILLE